MGLLSGIIAGAVGLVVAALRPVEYTAAAVFVVAQRAPEIPPVSSNPALTGEQIADALTGGPSDDLARDGAAGGDHSTEWVVGPALDQVSFRVTSRDRATAEAGAAAVRNGAGYGGQDLRRDGGPRPLLYLRADQPPVASSAVSPVSAVGLPAFAAGGSAALLVLAGTIRPRGAPTPAPLR